MLLLCDKFEKLIWWFLLWDPSRGYRQDVCLDSGHFNICCDFYSYLYINFKKVYYFSGYCSEALVLTFWDFTYDSLEGWGILTTEEKKKHIFMTASEFQLVLLAHSLYSECQKQVCNSSSLSRGVKVYCIIGGRIIKYFMYRFSNCSSSQRSSLSE